MNSASPIQDVLVCGWFVIVAAAFWSPYFNLALPVGPLNALYAVFLLIFLAAFALRLLRPGSPEANEANEGADPSVPARKEVATRRGR